MYVCILVGKFAYRGEMKPASLLAPVCSQKEKKKKKRKKEKKKKRKKRKKEKKKKRKKEKKKKRKYLLIVCET